MEEIMSDSNLTLDIRFDGPPGPESGHFIEAEIGGTSVGIGEWVEDGDDWLLRIPWTSPEEVELLNRRLAEAVSTGEELLARGEKMDLDLEKWRAAERETSDAYLRIRELVGAWRTTEGGANRYEVTEAAIKELIRRLEQQRVDATVCPVKATDYAIKHKLRYPEDLSCPRLDKTDDSEVQAELLAEMDRLRAELEEVRKVRRESCELCDVANKLHGPLYPSPKPGHVTSDQCGPCDDTCAYPEPGDPGCKELTCKTCKTAWEVDPSKQTCPYWTADDWDMGSPACAEWRERVGTHYPEPGDPDCVAADDKNSREHLAIKTTIGKIADAVADLIKVELAKGTVFECERVLLSNTLESVLRARAFLPMPAGRLSSKSVQDLVREAAGDRPLGTCEICGRYVDNGEHFIIDLDGADTLVHIGCIRDAVRAISPHGAPWTKPDRPDPKPEE